jgi:hypothetical protein
VGISIAISGTFQIENLCKFIAGRSLKVVQTLYIAAAIFYTLNLASRKYPESVVMFASRSRALPVLQQHAPWHHLEIEPRAFQEA